MSKLKIREAEKKDWNAILELNRLAFEGDIEASLIAALAENGLVRASLVAEEEGRIVGHILFSEISLEGEAETLPVLALAPMAVHPDKQRQGIGKLLLNAGIGHCKKLDFAAVFVLGHPGFYDRLGFSPSLASNFDSPYAGPAFMALELKKDGLKNKKGRVVYSRPFLDLES